MKEFDYIDSLAVAEESCAQRLAEFLGKNVWRGLNPGETECGVFNIGRLQTGEHCCYNAEALHFRASLDLFNRDRTGILRDIMRLLAAFPVNADLRTDDPLREESNMMVFRVAPEARAIGEALPAEVAVKTNASPVWAYRATAAIDVVFRTARRWKAPLRYVSIHAPTGARPLTAKKEHPREECPD